MSKNTPMPNPEIYEDEFRQRVGIINETLDDLERRGVGGYVSAWDSIGTELRALHELVGKSGQPDALSSVFEKHKAAMNRWNELNRRVDVNQAWGYEERVLSAQEIKEAIASYRQLVEDLRDTIPEIRKKIADLVPYALEEATEASFDMTPELAENEEILTLETLEFNAGSYNILEFPKVKLIHDRDTDGCRFIPDSNIRVDNVYDATSQQAVIDILDTLNIYSDYRHFDYERYEPVFLDINTNDLNQAIAAGKLKITLNEGGTGATIERG